MFVMSEVCKKNNHINNFDSSITPWTNEREKHSVSFIWNQTVFVYNLQICLFVTFSFKMYMPTKTFKIKGYKIMLKGPNSDRKSQFSQTLTETLNPRDH